MPVTLKDVLALLPELFPGIQEVPLERIRSNPDNPGPPPTDEQVAELAANIAEVGLLNPIKLMADPAGPLAPGAALHPENPRLRADGNPWALKDFNFRNLSGESRYRAHQLLKKPTIKSLILNPSAEEAVILSHGDNQVRDRGWWSDYKTIENLNKANPKLSQRQVAAKLKLDKDKTNRAIGLLPLLNQASRDLIVGVTDIKNKGKQQISELAACQLTGLGPESPHKPGMKAQDSEDSKLWPYPAIPPEIQDLVYRALVVVAKYKMTEAQAKEFVEWILGGKPPEDYYPEIKARTARKPPVRRSRTDGQALGAPISKSEMGASSAKTPETKTAESTVSTVQAPPADPTPTQPEPKKKPLNLILEFLADINPLSGIKKKVKSGEALTAGEDALLAGHDLEKTAKWLSKEAKPLLHGIWHKYRGFVKDVANVIVPHPHSKGAGLNRPAEALWHQAVYLFLLGLPLWALLGLVPFVQHLLVYGLYRLARWLTVDIYSEAFYWVTHHWIQAAIVAGVVLLVQIFVPQGRRLITLAALAFLVWLWSFARAPEPRLQVEGQDLAAPISQTKQEMGEEGESNPLASVPQPQVEGQRTPISKQEIGADETHPTVPPLSTIEKPKVAKFGKPNPPEHSMDSTTLSNVSNAFNGDPEILALLQAEILAIPPNCIIKPYPVEPDSSIGQLMAVNRLGDLAVESEYSLRVGQGGQKITSLTPSATGVVIVTEGGLPLGSFLGGGSTFGFYWEDVLTIYCDELDVKENGKTKIIYQCSITATNLNQPLVVQCYTANNLKHLVSALEYFIKIAQGKYVPVTGMPYLNQGMVLGDENKITAIWAESPAEKAQLELGYQLWSVNSEKRMQKAEIESALEALPSGRQDVEAVIPKDWDAEVEKEERLKSKAFHPFVLDFELKVP